jgi:hypothetical protein
VRVGIVEAGHDGAPFQIDAPGVVGTVRNTGIADSSDAAIPDENRRGYGRRPVCDHVTVDENQVGHRVTLTPR